MLQHNAVNNNSFLAKSEVPKAVTMRNKQSAVTR